MPRAHRKSLSPRLLQFLAAAASLLLAASQTQAVIDASLQMQLGNPTAATADPNNHSHYLIQRPVETIDYNDNEGQPNWASWDLTASDVGSSGRTDAWATDTSLPSGFKVIPTSTYGSVGGQSYDRGHMCPSADRTDTVADNEQVFIMSNIIPQASAQNQGVWNTFEGYCRTLLISQECLITCGPYNFGPNHVDSGLVGIAANTFKIVVCVPLDGTTNTALTRLTNANPNSIRIIALEIPNTDAAGSSPWSSFVTSTKQVQNDTGYNFFSALPNNLAWVLRSKVDGQTSPAPGAITFSPSSGPAGGSVAITGTALDTITNVTFSGTVAAYTITSPTTISATVPSGAASGKIAVQGLGGNATSANNFTVGSAPDLAIRVSHNGNFTQGDVGDTYTIIVTNLGSAASSGTVAVTDTLPAGLTATALSGTGWNANLATLTCTRSDTLNPAAAYPSITLTVSVSASAPASVSNTATVSGGNDSDPANNTATDPTTINSSGGSSGPTNVVMSQIYGGGGNSGASYQNDFVELFNPGPSAVSVGAWSVQYASASGSTWQVTALSGSIQPYHYYLVKLASGGSTGAALPTADATGTINMSATSGKIALVSSQTALSGTNPNGSSGLMDFVGYGSPSAYEGTGAAPGINNTTSLLRKDGGYANTTNNANDFATLTPPNPRNSASPANPPAPTPVPDLAIAISHTGSFTQGDTGDTYTIIITNKGSAATTGTVTFTDTLPAGLTATAISGSGWTPNLATLTCTRSDALAAGSSYSPLTVTVSVSTSAPASVTNTVTVAGGGDTSTGNNTATDPTAIIPLTPIQAWRLQYFGTTANTGPAADTAVASSDGMPNLLKYALGLNPLVAATNPVVGDITTGHLRLTCPKNPNATDITYSVELTSDLTNGPWTTNGTTVDQNTSTLLQVHDNTPVAGTPSRFIRLHITRP